MKKYLLITSLCLLGTSFLWGQSTWTGLGADDFWNTSGNWSPGTPGFNETAIFNGSAIPVDVNGVSKVGVSLDFQTAGWTISDIPGTGNLRIDGGISPYDINSVGSGVNTIAAKLTTTGSATISYNIGANNTLVLSGDNSLKKTSTITGSGTLVYNGPDQSPSYNQDYVMSGDVTILANNQIALGKSATFGNGTLGGTGRIGMLDGGSDYTFENSTIAPGGNGTFGAEIESLDFGLAGGQAGSILFGDNSTLAIQLGTTLGSNDLMTYESQRGNEGVKITGTNTTLALFGTTVEAGTYEIFTIFASAGGSDLEGTFDTVTFNGVAVDPSDITVTYAADSINVNVLTAIPEPGSLILLGFAGLALVIFRRRK